MEITKAIDLGKEFYLSKRLALSNPTNKRGFLDKHGEFFEKMRSKIKSTLEDTEYFHGTGARHYANNGHKYYGIDHNQINDSLGSFLKNGILPQKDIFNEVFDGSSGTISLTKLNLYARVYASLFLEEGNDLEYEFGSRAFWWRYLLLKMVIDSLTDTKFIADKIRGSISRVLDSEKRERYLEERRKRKEMIQNWTSSFRKDKKYIKKPIGVMEKAKSDIKGNYPIIFGIKSGTIETIPLSIRSVGMYESRTKKPISPEAFSHIQVPLKNLEEAQHKVDETALDLPVIPIEFVEIIASETPIIKHLTPEQIRN